MSEAMSSLYFVEINHRKNATQEDTLKISAVKNSLLKESAAIVCLFGLFTGQTLV
jgi:hypothetical protein